jgi:hypothetical protein
MQRYFFDVLGGGRTELDFKGIEFDNLDKAQQHAELIALDFGISTDDAQPERREVLLRNVAGKLLFAIPIRPSLVVAA